MTDYISSLQILLDSSNGFGVFIVSPGSRRTLYTILRTPVYDVSSRRRPPTFQHLQLAVPLVFKSLFGWPHICKGGRGWGGGGELHPAPFILFLCVTIPVFLQLQDRCNLLSQIYALYMHKWLQNLGQRSDAHQSVLGLSSFSSLLSSGILSPLIVPLSSAALHV